MKNMRKKLFVSLVLAIVSITSFAGCNTVSETPLSDLLPENSGVYESSENISSSPQSSVETSSEESSSVESSSVESSIMELSSTVSNNSVDEEVQYIIEDAYTSVDRGEWEEAIQSLEEAKLTYSDNNDINSAYDDIKKKMPISLMNIVTVSSENIEILSDPIKDRYGNVYDGGVQYKTRPYDAFGLYNLNKEYTKFNATAFVSEGSYNGRKISVSIYLDNKLVFFKDEISEETKPLKISLDIANADVMRIVATDEGGNATSRLIFADTDFAKVED